MKVVVLAFTLKGQDFAQIADTARKLKSDLGDAVLIHGFMPRDEVESRGFSTEVVDLLKELFPVQLNMYSNGSPMRSEMAFLAKKMGAKVYVLGSIIEGVEQEVEMYQNARLDINHVPIPQSESDKFQIIQLARPLSFGEMLVGIKFNPSNDDKVGAAKQLFADAADLLNDENNSRETSQFSQRLFSHSVCEILNAQMNVVKVLTLKY